MVYEVTLVPRRVAWNATRLGFFGSHVVNMQKLRQQRIYICSQLFIIATLVFGTALPSVAGIPKTTIQSNGVLDVDLAPGSDRGHITLSLHELTHCMTDQKMYFVISYVRDNVEKFGGIRAVVRRPCRWQLRGR